MKTTIFACAAAAALLAGCSSTGAPEATRAGAPAAAGVSTVAASPGSIAGYLHRPEVSRFALGATRSSVREGHYLRRLGENGVLATTDTGATIGVLNADKIDLVLRDTGPLTNDPAEHEKKVRDYFVAGGLPAEQIGHVHTMTLMQNEGSSFEDPGTKRAQFLAYTTILHRAVGGVTVEGSHASASFNANGDVTGEEVYWPELPASVLRDAQALRDQLSREGTGALKARLGDARYDDGEVMIHHSPHMAESFETFASVVFRGAGLPDRHLAADGRELRFTEEPLPAPTERPARR
jgi:hypothetical protein